MGKEEEEGMLENNVVKAKKSSKSSELKDRKEGKSMLIENLRKESNKKE
jgi:hypothetical protein